MQACYARQRLGMFYNLLLYFQDERTFSEEEEERLAPTLGLDGADLELVIQTLEFFLQQVYCVDLNFILLQLFYYFIL